MRTTHLTWNGMTMAPKCSDCCGQPDYALCHNRWSMHGHERHANLL